MPIIAGAKKALRQNEKNRARNDHFRDLYRRQRVAFESAIKAGDLEKAKTIYQNTKKDGKTVSAWLQATIDKLAKKNIIHKKNAARKKAKFVRMMKALS